MTATETFMGSTRNRKTSQSGASTDLENIYAKNLVRGGFKQLPKSNSMAKLEDFQSNRPVMKRVS
jgi:hypothetical protein